MSLSASCSQQAPADLGRFAALPDELEDGSDLRSDIPDCPSCPDPDVLGSLDAPEWRMDPLWRRILGRVTSSGVASSEDMDGSGDAADGCLDLRGISA